MKTTDTKRLQAQIAHIAAKLIDDEGFNDFAKAKKKALDRLNLPPKTPLPEDAQIEEELRLIQRLYADDAQLNHIRFLREQALICMEKLVQFRPYLTGSVLNGNAGRYAEIDIQLYPDSGKEVEIFLLNNKMNYEHSVPRAERAEAVLTLEEENATINLVIYAPHDERVHFKTRDKKPRAKANLATLRKLLEEENEVIPS